MKSTILIGEQSIEVTDYRDRIKDYRILNKKEFSEERPDFIPYIDEKFFESQGYSLPVVKMDEDTYIFPAQAKAIGKKSTLKDYSEFCLVNLDILVAIQQYYYNQAKMDSERNPRFEKRYRWNNSKLIWKDSKIKIRKRGSNTMSWVQSNLSSLIHGKDNRWISHKELQEEMKYKTNDIQFQIEELENVFAKGEQTSYGDAKLNDKLFEKYGVKVKLQNGEIIQKRHIEIIEKALISFYQTIGNLKKICKEFQLKISYAQDTHMHGRNATGIFYAYFNAVGISELGNAKQNLAHEVGHFIDFYLGDKNYRYYLSDDKSSIAGKIANTFRKNTVNIQVSEYQNRTKECFARSIEQYFCLVNNIQIDNSKGNYCTTKDFEMHIMPLIAELKQQLSLNL